MGIRPYQVASPTGWLRNFVGSATLEKYYQARWESIFAERFSANILTNAATICPLIDSRITAITSTTFATRRAHANGISATWTWSAAPNALTNPFSLKRAGSYTVPGLHGPDGIPGVLFNGSSEYLTTPDAAGWTHGNGTNDEAFSLSAWIVAATSASDRAIFAKFQETGSQYEYIWFIVGTTNLLKFELAHVNAVQVCSRSTDAAITLGVPIHIGVTYDGTGGATAMNGVTVYLNGAVVASTATNNASYVAMNDTTTTPSIASDIAAGGGGGAFFNSIFFGGPLGPAHVDAVALTAAQMKNDYDLGAGALSL